MVGLMSMLVCFCFVLFLFYYVVGALKGSHEESVFFGVGTPFVVLFSGEATIKEDHGAHPVRTVLVTLRPQPFRMVVWNGWQVVSSRILASPESWDYVPPSP